MQIKVFHDISFPEDQCEVITMDEDEVATCDDLMQMLQDKLFCHRNVKECDHVRLPIWRQF